MNEIIHNPNLKFKSIDRVVATGDNEKNLILKNGGNDELYDFTDFNEYGWDFFVRKLGENDNDPLNYMTDDVFKSNNLSHRDIEILRKTLFPTIDSEKELTTDNYKKFRYFGCINIGKQTLYMIHIPPLYKTVEFYEDDNNNTLFSVKFKDREIDHHKILWFVVTKGSEHNVSDISISQISFNYSDNKFRNMEKYLVPTDTLFTPSDVCKKTDCGEWIDESSGTILGTEEVNKPPLLNYVMNKTIARYGESDGTYKWNANVDYHKGSEVSYNSKVWYALEDCIGTPPPFSKSWILKSNLMYKINRGVIRLIDDTDSDNVFEIAEEGAPEVSPTMFTYNSSSNNTGYIKFHIIYKNGYVLDLPSSSKDRSTLGIYDYNVKKLNDGNNKYLSYGDQEYADYYTYGDDEGFDLSFPAKSDIYDIKFRKYNCYFHIVGYGDHVNIVSVNTRANYPNSYHIGEQIVVKVSVDNGYTLSKVHMISTITTVSWIPLPTIWGEDGEVSYAGKQATGIVNTEEVGFAKDSDSSNNYYIIDAFTFNKPCDYEMNFEVESIKHIVTITDHGGFFVNVSSQVVEDKATDVIFLLYPTNGKVDVNNDNIHVEVAMNGVTMPKQNEFTASNNPCNIRLYDDSGEKLMTRVALVPKETYYLLAINWTNEKDDQNEDRGIGGAVYDDINLKVWK